jgi:hypothetical protein
MAAEKVLSKTTVAVSAAIVLSSTLPATSKHRHVTHVHPTIYNMMPDVIGGSCPPSGGPSCSSSCSGYSKRD